MTSHADTIRSLLPLWHVGGTQGDRLRSELEAMEAENQRLREALRFYAYNPQYAGDIAREALAGDAE